MIGVVREGCPKDLGRKFTVLEGVLTSALARRGLLQPILDLAGQFSGHLGRSLRPS